MRYAFPGKDTEARPHRRVGDREEAMAMELSPTPAALLIEGGAGCGKTERLVERVASLLEGGATPDDLLVLTATPDAARALAARLAARSVAAARVRVTTPRAVALELLGTEEGRAFSGRSGRLVTPVEMGFIMEDMKTCGLKNRRLKEMLKFFYRNWTELAEGADGQGDWLLPGEETQVHDLLKDILGFTGGILEPEVAAMAVRFLLASPEALTAAQRSCVLVDDYQMLSRASQHLANLLARDSVTVAADPAAVVQVFESYPYGEGVGEFTQANGACERIVLAESHRCAAATAAAMRLRTEIDEDAAPLACADEAPAADSFTALETADPAAEIVAVADAVEAALAAGTDPASVYVLTFRPAWTRSVVRALGARGIQAAAPVEGHLYVGDYRDLDRCAPARLLTALALVADPSDALAWRCWCGFGDYLANSAAFADLRTGATAEGKPLAALLDEVAAAAPAEGFPGTGIGRVLDAYRAGRSLIDTAAGLEGDTLVDALAASCDLAGEDSERAIGIVRALAAPSPDDTLAGDDAAALAQRARRRMNAPIFECDKGSVLVGGPEHLAGLSPDVLVLAGFVNGFFPVRDYFDASAMPPDKQQLTRATDVRRLYATVGKAGRRLTASWFTSIDLVGAEQLKLEIGRVRLRRGERIATTSPSIYLKKIEPAEDQSA